MRINPGLAPFKDQIPSLLEAIRAGSQSGSLLSLCEELGPLLSIAAPATLRQQWLRWTSPLRVVTSGKEPKPQQVPTLDNLLRIYSEAVVRNWVPARVPGAEQLCDLLADEFKRSQAEIADRIKRKRRHGVQLFVDGLVDDFLQDEGEPHQLWHTLPVGLGQALAEALVRSLQQRLVFEPTRVRTHKNPFWAARAAQLARLGETSAGKKAAMRRARAFNEHAKADAFAASSDMLRDIAENFTLPLVEYAKEIMELQKERAAEYEEHMAMEANAVDTDALEAAERGPEVEYRLGDAWKTDGSGNPK